ncbi:MAG TPA: 23S rRNA (pseudouridine(1915)-N(3))-methyltransferase RlmH [Candidatus Saccharimonadia bacterium]|nr:23S rRNA (pseudouridine(1915)-N(3))-methyltransferase RlmH [Candidatus Saccharimonadia bacterium]
MRIVLVAIGEKAPAWVREGYADYAKRLPKPYAPELVELPLGARSKSRDPARAIIEEGERVLAALPRQAHVVALDERGKSFSSVELSRELARWARDGHDVALVIGGPDGHAPDVLARAQQRMSLSALTLPHMLVRLVVIEQLYRAWTLLEGHPYHRA